MQEIARSIFTNKEILLYCLILLILILLYIIFELYIRMGICQATIVLIGTLMLMAFLTLSASFVDQDLQEKHINVDVTRKNFAVL